jgi:hypothetical protein
MTFVISLIMPIQSSKAPWEGRSFLTGTCINSLHLAAADFPRTYRREQSMSSIHVKFITVSAFLTKVQVACMEIANLLMKALHYTTPKLIKGFGMNQSQVGFQ